MKALELHAITTKWFSWKTPYQATRAMCKSLKENDGLIKHNLFVETKQEQEESLPNVSINQYAEDVVG